MELLDNIVLLSIDNLYLTLSLLGYINKSYIDKLIVIMWINWLLHRDIRFILSESDYKTLLRALDCLFGSNCLIPYPEYSKGSSSYHDYNGPILYRLAQDGCFRYTESSRIRTT